MLVRLCRLDLIASLMGCEDINMFSNGMGADVIIASLMGCEDINMRVCDEQHLYVDSIPHGMRGYKFE